LGLSGAQMSIWPVPASSAGAVFWLWQVIQPTPSASVALLPSEMALPVPPTDALLGSSNGRTAVGSFTNVAPAGAWQLMHTLEFVLRSAAWAAPFFWARSLFSCSVTGSCAFMMRPVWAWAIAEVDQSSSIWLWHPAHDCDVAKLSDAVCTTRWVPPKTSHTWKASTMNSAIV